MARRTKEEALATREQLLDAAERVFRERGVGHASLAEVADAAGVTRGAIYWHFESKADLFQAMVARAEMPQEASLQRMEEVAKTDPLAALRMGAIESLLAIARDERARRVYDVVFLRCEYTEELAAVRTWHAQSRDQCYARIERVMRAAVACGQLPEQLDVKVAARGMYAYVGGLMRDALEVPETVNLARNAESFVDTYLAGLQHTPAAAARRAAAPKGASAARRRPTRRANGRAVRG